jgi:hypothetical protein
LSSVCNVSDDDQAYQNTSDAKYNILTIEF